MYSNFKNYSVDYDENAHVFSCYYRRDGQTERRAFVKDAKIVDIRTLQGESVSLSDYKKVHINAQPVLGSNELNVLYSDGPASAPSLSLHFQLNSTSLQVYTTAIAASVSIEGSLLWGDDPENATFGVRLNVEDHTLRTACGPAVSIHDNALFDRLSDQALEFNASDKSRVCYDWKSSCHRFSFRSGAHYVRSLVCSLKVHENYCQRKFNIPYAPIKKGHGFKTPPVGWMTWYAVQFKASEQVVLENARVLASTFGKYTGQLCLWVDWEWNHKALNAVGPEGVDTFTPRKDAYPNGLAHVANEIEKLGLIPALWIGATHEGQRNHLLKEHPEWVLAEKLEWCGQLWVDPSHPGVVGEYIPAIFKQILEWGYKVIKWDCLPMTFNICDQFHSKFHNPELSTDVAVRNVIQAARETIGPDVYMLSCSGETEREITVAMDIFDAARVGGDIFGWEEFIANSVERVLRFYPWHNVVLYADGDNLVLRNEFNSLAQARSRVSFYGLTGLPVTLGDHLPDLDVPRMDMLKRIIPVADIHPMDLQQKTRGDGYVLVNLAVCKEFGQWNVVDIFNTKDTPLTLTLSLEADLHLDTRDGRRHAVYSFWEEKFLGIHGETLTVEIAPQDSAVLRITPIEPHPQLISTSRHITQGAYDLESLSWDGKDACLSGKSKLVEGDTYRLSIYVPEGYEFAEAKLPKGCDAKILSGGDKRLLSVEISSNKSGLTDWRLGFSSLLK